MFTGAEGKDFSISFGKHDLSLSLQAATKKYRRYPVWLIHKRNILLAVLEAESLGSRGQQIRYLVRTQFLVHRQRLLTTSAIMSAWKGQGSSLGSLLEGYQA